MKYKKIGDDWLIGFDLKDWAVLFRFRKYKEYHTRHDCYEFQFLCFAVWKQKRFKR